MAMSFLSVQEKEDELKDEHHERSAKPVKGQADNYLPMTLHNQIQIVSGRLTAYSVETHRLRMCFIHTGGSQTHAKLGSNSETAKRGLFPNSPQTDRNS
jgi:hypothetical protein